MGKIGGSCPTSGTSATAPTCPRTGSPATSRAAARPAGSRTNPGARNCVPAGPQRPGRPAGHAVLRGGVPAVGRRRRVLRPRDPGVRRRPRLPRHRRAVRGHRPPGDVPRPAARRPARGGRPQPARRRAPHARPRAATRRSSRSGRTTTSRCSRSPHRTAPTTWSTPSRPRPTSRCWATACASRAAGTRSRWRRTSTGCCRDDPATSCRSRDPAFVERVRHAHERNAPCRASSSPSSSPSTA